MHVKALGKRGFIVEYRIDLYAETGLTMLAGRSNIQSLMEKKGVEIRRLRDGDMLVCDFQGVLACSPSYLSELFGQIDKYLEGKENILIAVKNISNELMTDFEAFAIHSKVRRGVPFSAIFQRSAEWDLIGTVDKTGRKVFELLKEHSLTARELADLTDVKINAASNQLKRLYEERLVFRREIIDAEGKKYVYYLK